MIYYAVLNFDGSIRVSANSGSLHIFNCEQMAIRYKDYANNEYADSCTVQRIAISEALY